MRADKLAALKEIGVTRLSLGVEHFDDAILEANGRAHLSAEVYRGNIWVLGGWSNGPSKNWNDVWYSPDGKNWKELKTKTIWGIRHEHSAYVFQDKLWVVGGHAAPLTNDVWQLDLPKDWK